MSVLRKIIMILALVMGIFNLAATTAQITSPLSGQAVSGPLPLIGTASADMPAFDHYVLEYGKGTSPVSWLKHGTYTTPVTAGTLATFNTYRLENEMYTFRLTVFDALGNQSSATVSVAVNNTTRPGLPHGNYQIDSDLCALCHGTHTGIFAPGILRFGATRFQSQLCYTCHNGTGSVYDVATEFDTGSAHHPIQDTVYAGDAQHTMNCTDCHDPHGSQETAGRSYPALLRSKAADGSVSYQGNPYCYACHGVNGIIVDRRYFETNNGHNNTDAGQTTVFPDPTTGTKIKCSICHEPHGGTQAKLRVNADKDLCGACHPEPSPYTIRADNEVITGVGYPETVFGQPFYAGTRVFSQDTFTVSGAALKGPKEYRTPTLSFPPRLRGIAVGDATNVGRNAVVGTITSGASSTLGVWVRSVDGFSLTAAKMFSNRGGYGVAVGDVNSDTSNETVVALMGSPGVISVLNIIGDAVTGATNYLTGGNEPRKVAIGDITGDGVPEVVVTNYGTNNITVFKQSGAVLTRVGPFAAGGTYTYGLALGDVDGDGTAEVVVANHGYEGQTAYNENPPYTADNITVFNADLNGNLTLAGTLDNGDATAAWDVAVGNVIDNAPGQEIVVVGHPMWPSGQTVNGRIAVFNMNDNSARAYDAGATDSKGVAIGDVNADGSPDVVVLSANAVSVFSHGVADLAAPSVYSMAGMNTVGLADEPGPIALGDVVKAHPYGHRIEAMGVCTGCHDPHSVTKAAPVWGSTGYEPVYGATTTYTLVPHVVKDYQLCYKCHSGASVPLVGPRDVAEELNPNNASYHAVMAAGKRSDMPAGSFVGAWNQTSRLLCGDCHGKDALAPQQMRHGSANAYFLRKPYAGLPPSNSYLLCYTCHNVTFYGPGAATPAGNYTWNRIESEKDHRLHSNRGVNCATCHNMHGSATTSGMIRPDMNMGGSPPGPFTCTVACH
ncbi:MAG: cytochrome c3 family protein [Actinomycetota bacterium]